MTGNGILSLHECINGTKFYVAKMGGPNSPEGLSPGNILQERLVDSIVIVTKTLTRTRMKGTKLYLHCYWIRTLHLLTSQFIVSFSL